MYIYFVNYGGLRFKKSKIWSKRVRTFECRYQKPMPFHLAILHNNILLPTPMIGVDTLFISTIVYVYIDDYFQLAYEVNFFLDKLSPDFYMH